MPPALHLKNFNFVELFHPEGLNRLDTYFLKQLKTKTPVLHDNLLDYRQETKTFSSLEVSELLLALAPILEEFIIDLFQIEEAASLQQAKTLSHNPISAFKKFFVLRRAKKQISQIEKIADFATLNQWLEEQIAKSPIKTDDKELAVSLLATHYVSDADQFKEEINQLTDWCVHALITPEAKQLVKNWVSFRLPERIDYNNLVPHVAEPYDKLTRLTALNDHLRQRDGFQLTDPRMNAREVQDEVNYCIYCHDHEGDFCSKGFPVKKGDPTQGFKKNPLDITLTGCPLEEKISEMHQLKRDGFTIAALAMVMVDNPMCPATGHRICNDCMKACIYQKQDPVNIPQIETRVLTDVLNLPWGVEIYDLLTRFNPLRQKQFILKPYNGLKIMIAGMGPAGFTLAHHLLLEGFAVLGFDGLKIEPLPEHLLTSPIYAFEDLKESLDSRVMAGFGGVAEYGITVRWDKNFLKLIYISLMRRPTFQAFGCTRFGGTIHIADAWEMGFDHFVVAVGAGLPKALSIPGSLAPGMRQANDFLMALQLGNAAKKESLTNIQIRLPAVVIGGGLTGVDTATEVQAYYITQVEKISYRYQKLVESYGEDTVRQELDQASIEILEEFLSHGKAVQKERERAANEGKKPDFISLIRKWGGVTIVYRRKMQESPAYINNHEELTKALQEGIFYSEELEPARVILNQYGHAETLVCHKRYQKNPNEWETLKEDIFIPARAIFVATGTQPNIAYEFEHRGTFTRLGLQYQHYEDKNGELIIPHGISHCKDRDFGAFTSYHKQDFRVSLVGDTHPIFHGNVVKAIASGMRTFPKILEVLKNKLGKIGDINEYAQFREKMSYLFKTTVSDIVRRTENVLELTVTAPLAAKHFQAGQFFRLQNYETFAPRIDHTSLQTEPIALIAADVDKKQHTLKFIIIENGASTKLCATFKKNDPVALMGPTGVRGKISEEHETVLIIGNQLSLALINSYGGALKAAGNRVIFVGFFSDSSEIYNQTDIEKVTDFIIWTTPKGKIIPNRPTDISTTENVLDILLTYHDKIPLSDVDRIYLIGKSDFLREFQAARTNQLKPLLLKNPLIYGSVYSTMQCMLKGVCAQCLQWQIDPETGKRTKAVFACSWPDQPLELIDFDNLEERQIQNRLQETISRLWVKYLFENYQILKI